MWHSVVFVEWGLYFVTVVRKQIDKEGANPQVVMQELSTHGLMPEEWGGDTPMVQVKHLCHVHLS